MLQGHGDDATAGGNSAARQRAALVGHRFLRQPQNVSVAGGNG
jgi:hypothetical protein